MTAVYDKSSKTSTIEVFCFLQTGFIQDKFRLRSNREQIESKTFGGERDYAPRVSIVDAMKEKRPSFTRQSSAHEMGSFTSLPNGFELVQNTETEKVSRVVSVPCINKIKDLVYCEQLDILSVGLQNGSVANFRLEIENAG